LGGDALRKRTGKQPRNTSPPAGRTLPRAAASRPGAAAPQSLTPPTPLPPPNPTPEPTPAPGPSSPILIQPQPQPQPSASQDRAGLRVVGIVTASVGVAALLAAVALNVKANSMASGDSVHGQRICQGERSEDLRGRFVGGLRRRYRWRGNRRRPVRIGLRSGGKRIGQRRSPACRCPRSRGRDDDRGISNERSVNPPAVPLWWRTLGHGFALPRWRSLFSFRRRVQA